MRTNTTLVRTIASLAVFAAGCSDAPTMTSTDNQTACVRSNSGTVDCSSMISSLHPSASTFYEHDVTGVGSYSSFAQPTAAYVQGTTKIDISALTDLSFHNSITDGAQTVSFLYGGPLQRRTVPSSWGVWSSPPHSESSTPPVLFGTSTLVTALTLSQPAAVVGFEVEGNTFGAYEFLVEFYDEDYKLLGFVRRTVDSDAGARLFSFSTDWAKKISRVDISGGGPSGYFAIAQVRYSLTPFAATGNGITIDIKPGTTPNDIHRSSKGRVPVAVLTTPTFNAANVDVASVTLGNEAAQDTPVAQQNKGAPMASFKDVDFDGDLDLILQFDIPALVANGDLTASTTQLVLKASLIGGGAVRGVDSVTPKP